MIGALAPLPSLAGGLSDQVTDGALPGASLATRAPMVGPAATAMVDGMVNQQAAMIAYLDDFYLMSWISFAAVQLVLHDPS